MIYQILLMLFILTSCNENFTGGNRFDQPTQQEQQPVVVPPVQFITRLTNSLAIKGDRCRGDETTEPDGHGRICEAGEYLVYIDDVNICDDSGRCTDNVVTPIVAELDDIDARIPGVGIFDINPISLTTQDQREILETVSVKSDSNGNGTVFFK